MPFHKNKVTKHYVIALLKLHTKKILPKPLIKRCIAQSEVYATSIDV